MKIRACCIGLLLACLTLPLHGANPNVRPLPGLTVDDGQLLLQGESYRGIGANYFSLFSRTLEDSSDLSYRKGLKQLAEARIPFVRFMACGFWPIDWDLYLRDKESYFKRLDAIVQCAEENKIGLIPSLFWNMATAADVAGEPIDQLGNANSKTISFVRKYTEEVVLRYRHSSAIWGWEFGNEYNLHVDLPNASSHRPPVWPKLKTALNRTERDELTSKALLTAFAQFATTVRKYDKHRILITGNSTPRPSAYHNSIENSWTADSREQFEQILLRDNPDPFRTLSVHAYPVPDGRYSAHAQSLTALVKVAQRISLNAKKPLFIGEFGVSATLNTAEEQAGFIELVRAIETNNVPLSAFWVFDFASQNKNWNVTFDNRRNYMLKVVSKANQRMRKSPTLAK